MDLAGSDATSAALLVECRGRTEQDLQVPLPLMCLCVWGGCMCKAAR